MKIIKLNAIGSTNSYLINLSKSVKLEDLTFVVTDEQTKGRGQQGAVWESIPQQSLLFSVFKRFENLSISNISSIAFAVSIGIENALKVLNIPKTAIKWPNDIMSQSKKVAGILIENQIKQGNVISSIIGIGLNVNEASFKDLPQATSLLLETGIKYDLKKVLDIIIKELVLQLNKLENRDFKELKSTYESSLFRKEMISVFETPSGYRFNGIIKGVNDLGQIVIENEDEKRINFQLKEIKLLF